MSYFNDEQRGYMESLSRIPDDERCWCGWYRLGECPHCPTGATVAQKVAQKCPDCGNAPFRPGDSVTHLKNCARRDRRDGGK